MAPVASARGAALLAGLASGAFENAEDTLRFAPDTGETVRPDEKRPDYEAAYERYRELYPRLSG